MIKIIKKLFQTFKTKEPNNIKVEEKFEELQPKKAKNRKEKSGEIERILVIGCNLGIKSIFSYNWDEIPKYFNIADFNKVIIHLPPINFEENKRIYNKLKKHNVFNLIGNNNAEIIVIGIPKKEAYPYNSNYDWLPIFLKYTYSKGDTFQKITPEFKWYFSFVNEWFFHFEYYSEKDRHCEIKEMESLAKNIYGKPLGIRLKYVLKERSELIQSANIIWLPPPTKVDDSKAIIEILQNRYGICISTIEPEWVMKYRLPSERDIEKNIIEIAQKIEKEEYKIENLNKDLDKIKHKKKLLYEKGDTLREVVLESLKGLGAKLNGVKDKKKEDGRFTDPFDRKYIIEVKGSKDQLKRGDIRQLDDWVKSAQLEENWEGKGVLVGNYLCVLDIAERKNIVNNNEINALGRFGFSFLKTTQVFKALQLLENGSFNKKEFWNLIYDSNGLVDLPDLEENNKEVK